MRPSERLELQVTDCYEVTWAWQSRDGKRPVTVLERRLQSLDDAFLVVWL